MRRIQKFIDIKEVPADCLVQSDQASEYAVSIANQSFSWGVKGEPQKKKSKQKKPKDHTKMVSSRTASLRVPAENAVHESFEAGAEGMEFDEDIATEPEKKKHEQSSDTEQ